MTLPNDSDISPVVAALLAGMPKTRGRPPLGTKGSTDQVRAGLVLWVFSEYPGKFKTRRAAIGFLQKLSRAARHSGRGLDTFPDRNLTDLEQSVSKGMKLFERIHPGIEKLVKKSQVISHK